MTSNVRRNEVKKTKLNFRFHNPNPPEAFAEVLLRIMIDANGNVYGYVSGALTADMMESIVQQTMESVE